MAKAKNTYQGITSDGTTWTVTTTLVIEAMTVNLDRGVVAKGKFSSCQNTKNQYDAANVRHPEAEQFRVEVVPAVKIG